jgi:hypothetical protein
MLEVTIALIIGFALGYGVREWTFRQNSRAETPSVLKKAAARNGTLDSGGITGTCGGPMHWPSGALP